MLLVSSCCAGTLLIIRSPISSSSIFPKQDCYQHLLQHPLYEIAADHQLRSPILSPCRTIPRIDHCGSAKLESTNHRDIAARTMARGRPSPAGFRGNPPTAPQIKRDGLADPREWTADPQAGGAHHAATETHQVQSNTFAAAPEAPALPTIHQSPTFEHERTEAPLHISSHMVVT